MVFAMSLGLGIVGLEEVLELEFTEIIEPEEAQRRVAAQLPPGLEVLSARRIPTKVTAQVSRAGYRVAVPAERMAELPNQIDAVLAATECWVERTKPTRRRLNLRPFVSELRVTDQHLEMLLWVTPNGAARPGEILGLVGLGDLVESGVLIERHVLEIHDEIQQPGPTLPAQEPSRQPALPDGPPDSADKPARPTALISGPMSYDS
ncbi:MAG TPA: TIGR03936 family radical SAM-associated protein, partial [Gemmataceae bacterium]|nr:TIGR03936 family radical SAM-associated protein [Gemmataceae bacterium]